MHHLSLRGTLRGQLHRVFHCLHPELSASAVASRLLAPFQAPAHMGVSLGGSSAIRAVAAWLGVLPLVAVKRLAFRNRTVCPTPSPTSFQEGSFLRTASVAFRPCYQLYRTTTVTYMREIRMSFGIKLVVKWAV